MEKQQIEVIPYLAFSGNCQEALRAYMEAFGGEILYLSRWSQENTSSPELMGKVMHVEFRLGRTPMAAGDAPEGAAASTAVKLMIHMESKEEAERAVEVLAKGGDLLSPLKPHPKPDDGGCGSLIRDRFGFTWIITCPNPEAG